MANTFHSAGQFFHQRPYKLLGFSVRLCMVLPFWHTAVLIPSSKPFFEHVGWSSVYLRIPWIEQMKALMCKLPPCAGWICKGVWAQPNDNVPRPSLPIARRNATVRKPDARHIARRSVNVDTYQRNERSRGPNRSSISARYWLAYSGSVIGAWVPFSRNSVANRSSMTFIGGLRTQAAPGLPQSLRPTGQPPPAARATGRRGASSSPRRARRRPLGPPRRRSGQG